MSNFDFTITMPGDVQSSIQYTLDGILTQWSRPCTLYFPPLTQSASGTLNPAPGDIVSNTWSAGPPLPLASQQDFPYAGGNLTTPTIQVESSTGIMMLVHQDPGKFNTIFPVDDRFPAGTIVTQGFVTDLQSVTNCTRMETMLDLGSKYTYKLAGEPIVPSRLVKSRYFYAIWSRC